LTINFFQENLLIEQDNNWTLNCDFIISVGNKQKYFVNTNHYIHMYNTNYSFLIKNGDKIKSIDIFKNERRTLRDTFFKNKFKKETNIFSFNKKIKYCDDDDDDND
jgi:hypothetical protein